MMSEVSRKHPQLVAKVTEYIESGLNPEEIIQKFRQEDIDKANNKDSQLEEFPDEIHMISQALAYRKPNSSDLKEVTSLLTKAYREEVVGIESFRSGNVIDFEDLEKLFNDDSYHWLVVEAPSGKGIELDGVILGVCCYSTDGISRKDGQIEGSLGSIRYLAVLPRYKGLCIGRRMLAKVESLMIREGCIRSMACIASTRESMMEWIERRKYTAIGATPYPADALKHSLTSEDVGLIRFIKCLRKSIEDPSNFVLSSIDEKKTNDSEKPPQINTHLPPAWRYAIPSENDAGID